MNVNLNQIGQSPQPESSYSQRCSPCTIVKKLMELGQTVFSTLNLSVDSARKRRNLNQLQRIFDQFQQKYQEADPDLITYLQSKLQVLEICANNETTFDQFFYRAEILRDYIEVQDLWKILKDQKVELDIGFTENINQTFMRFKEGIEGEKNWNNEAYSDQVQYETCNSRKKWIEIRVLEQLALVNPKSYSTKFLDMVINFKSTTQAFADPDPDTYSLFHSIGTKHNGLHYAVYFNSYEKLDEIQSRLLPHLLENEKPLKVFHEAMRIALFETKNYGIANKLIEMGADLNYTNKKTPSLLLEAIKKSDLDALGYLLSFHNLDIRTQDCHGRNILHHARLEHAAPESLQMLLDDWRTLSLMQQKDHYGYSQENYASLDKDPIDIGQYSGLFPKFEAFLQTRMSEVDAEIFFKFAIGFRLEKGLCNGLTFLMYYYAVKGKLDQFYEMLEIISSWDCSSDSLKKPIDSSVLSNQYHNLEELFDQMINDAVWFQACVSGINEERIDEIRISNEFVTIMRDRELRYSIVKNFSDPEIRRIMSPLIVTVNSDMLAELLEVLTFQSGTFADMTGANGSHAFGIMTLPDGNKQYYDTDIKHRASKTTDNKILAGYIKDFVFKINGHNTEKMEIEIQILSDSPRSSKQDLNQLLKKDSHCGFTPLHIAVFANNKELFDKIMNENPSLIQQKDKFGNDPIFYARLMNNSELMIPNGPTPTCSSS